MEWLGGLKAVPLAEVRTLAAEARRLLAVGCDVRLRGNHERHVYPATHKLTKFEIAQTFSAPSNDFDAV